MGLCKWFREHHPEVTITAVEPYYGHKIQGLKNMKESYRPGIFNKALPTQIVNVADADAFETARMLARKEGIFVGMSSGASMYAALQRAREISEGLIVAILPDGGERYLGTSLFVPKARPDSTAPRLRLYNTMTRSKEEFRPLNKKRVTCFACGPTAYQSPNMGHCRRLAVADLMIRYLELKGFGCPLLHELYRYRRQYHYRRGSGRPAPEGVHL